MKTLTSVLFALALTSHANAKTFNCEVIDDNNSGLTQAKLTLETDHSKEIVLTVDYGNATVYSVVASKDSKYRGSDVRFIDTKVNLASSDSGETELLLSKSLLKGKAGKVTISGNQANDGENGDQYLWFVSAVLNCK